MRSLTRAQAAYQTLDEPIEACVSSAYAALCEIRLGQPAAAHSAVKFLLERLDAEFAERPAHETIETRWPCQQVLEALGDARAARMLQQLFAEVHARATELTHEADRDRLIQALPVFRSSVAAQQRRGEPTASG